MDLISYKITRVTPLQIVESAQGEGGLCGGAFLNLRFEEHMKARIGEARFNAYKLGKHWHKAQAFFEKDVKRSFGATYLKEFQVPVTGLPDDEAAGIEDNELTLTTEQLKDIFDPVINDVIDLVDHQVRELRSGGEEVAAIICVGGFGQSAYLQQRLKAHFRTDVPPAYSAAPASGSANGSVKNVENKAIDIMVSTDSWTACVRGALQRGLQDSIVMSRKCRFHYGVESNTLYREGIHPASSRVWNEIKDEFQAESVMRWYLQKGETIEKDRIVTFSFSLPWAEHPLSGNGEVKYSTTLFASAAPVQALMRSDASVFRVCTMSADLRAIPRRQFRKRTATSGKKYHSLQFELVMKVNSADIEFSMEIDGEPYGSVTASFDHSALAPSFDLTDD